ncbi:MAG: hypothetical protein MJ099_00495 [Clostridia bacterium]|nr:hypothetical protein [Clostridia bacterium]
MGMENCPHKAKEGSIIEKDCPNCGGTVELFSTEPQAECEDCGAVIYNDQMICVRKCQNARECVGDEAYEQLMKIL